MLAAAQRAFLARGYRAATMRAIAAGAQVDPALLNSRFGSKRGLFVAALGNPFDPAGRVAAALAGPADALSERLARAALDALREPRQRAAMRVMVAEALADEQLRVLLAEYVDREIVDRIADRVGGAHAHERARAVVSVLAGIVFTRHFVGVPSLIAAVSPEDVRRLEAAIRAAAAPPPRTGTPSP